MKHIITRRDFMRGTAYIALWGALGTRIEQPKRAKVVLIRHEKALDSKSRPDAQIIQHMFDEAVTTLLEVDDPVKAFRQLVKPDDIVGIKSNVWGYLPTPPELEQAIKRRLMDAGVQKRNINIDDRSVLRNPFFKKTTALINVRPLHTHYWSGIGGCIKNLIMFYPNPPDYHRDSCADLALLWKMPIVKGKTRLNILSVLNPLFHGRGPHHFDRRYVWNYKGIIVGTDPVAVDTVGLKLIQAKRLEHFGKERRLQTLPHHVMMADIKHGLGISDLNKIELIKLGWKEGLLI